MRWEVLRPIWLLRSRATLRRAALVATLALFERVLTPATAWALFARPLAWKLTAALLLAATFTLRGFAQRFNAARTEAELTVRVTSAVLEGDVLRTSVLPKDDARAELFQGIYHSSQQLAQDIPVLVGDLVATVVLAVTLSIFEPVRLLAMAVAFTVLAGGMLAWSRHRLHRENVRVWALQQHVVVQLVDALEGRLELVASGRRAAFVSETARRARAWGSASARVAASSVISGRLPLLVIAATAAIIVGLSSRSVDSLAMSAGDLVLFAAVTPAFAGVGQGLQAMVRAERWVAVVASVLETARVVTCGGESPPQLTAPVTFDNVTFRYGPPGGPPALHAFSCTWGPESVLALSGANGSGKSTCLRLLLALGSPLEGRVLVGGSDLANIDAEAWRARIAFLPQRPYLPPRSTVRSAIRLLAPEASDDEMHQVLRRVGLLPVLRRLGSELDADVDSLSVGQRQRIALARLLCRDAPLVILDEPDANLDRDGIALVVELVRELVLAGRRVILAAHTPELLALADRIIVLDEGRIRVE